VKGRLEASSATPLIALDAFVIDTETTGLDPAKARVVEIAFVPLTAGKIDEGSSLRSLINPGQPIPNSASQIHGIDDATVSLEPSFADARSLFSAFLTGSVLIGHTIAFDLAVLEREFQRAGSPWRQPRTLCTQLLAQAISPNLGGYSLEQLAAWLGVELAGRHSALGDAMTTARIFVALLPKLREQGIRTLAEAERACRAVSRRGFDGWSEVTHAAAETVFSRIDTYPYRHRVGDVMSKPVELVSPAAPLAKAIKLMSDKKISSLLVGDSLLASAVAIVTERDVLRAIAKAGGDAIDRAVTDFVSKPLITVPASAFIYRALGRMARMKMRHLGVIDEKGLVIGMVSARDLLRLRAQEATILGDAIDQAATIVELASAWARIPQAAAALVQESVSARDTAAVISRELGALTRQASILAEKRMAADGMGAPPCPYAVCVLGSAGRGESLLAMDQDNAIIFDHGEPGSTGDRWFAQFGEIIAETLHEVGVPYCPGGVMAKNAEWRGSVETWHGRIQRWVARSNPQDLLSIDIFFDLASVHGDLRLANEMRLYAFEVTKGDANFAKLLAQAAGRIETGLTFFGGFYLDNDRLNLKRKGLFGIVTVARILAIQHNILERSTPSRLAALLALGKGTSDLEAVSRAYSLFMDVVLKQQLADIESGRPPSSGVEVRRLSRAERSDLKDGLRAMSHVDILMQDLMF
jgi:CBS domain-containing protein